MKPSIRIDYCEHYKHPDECEEYHCRCKKAGKQCEEFKVDFYEAYLNFWITFFEWIKRLVTWPKRKLIEWCDDDNHMAMRDHDRYKGK